MIAAGNVAEINARKCGLRPEDAVEIADVITQGSHSALVRIEYVNTLTCALCVDLSNDTHEFGVSLKKNEIGDEGAVALAGVIRRSSKLTKLVYVFQ